MGASKNVESTRCEKDGVIYYDRGILTGKDGRRYQQDCYNITHNLFSNLCPQNTVHGHIKFFCFQIGKHLEIIAQCQGGMARL